MSRILLADDSPHAQRMGELILKEEGYDVVTLTDGASVIARLGDVDPDLILVDVGLPTKSGFEICQFVKSSLRHLHTRVVLASGASDPIDEQEVKRVQADGVLQKPFEATLVLAMIKPLLASAAAARISAPVVSEPPAPPSVESTSPTSASDPTPHASPDPELIRAAVTIALDAALPGLIEEIARNVLAALNVKIE